MAFDDMVILENDMVTSAPVTQREDSFQVTESRIEEYHETSVSIAPNYLPINEDVSSAAMGGGQTIDHSIIVQAIEASLNATSHGSEMPEALANLQETSDIENPESTAKKAVHELLQSIGNIFPTVVASSTAEISDSEAFAAEEMAIVADHVNMQKNNSPKESDLEKRMSVQESMLAEESQPAQDRHRAQDGHPAHEDQIAQHDQLVQGDQPADDSELVQVAQMGEESEQAQRDQPSSASGLVQESEPTLEKEAPHLSEPEQEEKPVQEMEQIQQIQLTFKIESTQVIEVMKESEQALQIESPQEIESTQVIELTQEIEPAQRTELTKGLILLEENQIAQEIESSKEVKIIQEEVKLVEETEPAKEVESSKGLKPIEDEVKSTDEIEQIHEQIHEAEPIQKTEPTQKSDQTQEGEPATQSKDVIDGEIQAIKGQKVVKKFGKKSFVGEVVDFDIETKWFKVVYEDGDEEDLELWEVKQILASPSCTPTSKKRPLTDEGADISSQRSLTRPYKRKVESTAKKTRSGPKKSPGKSPKTPRSRVKSSKSVRKSSTSRKSKSPGKLIKKALNYPSAVKTPKDSNVVEKKTKGNTTDLSDLKTPKNSEVTEKKKRALMTPEISGVSNKKRKGNEGTTSSSAKVPENSQGRERKGKGKAGVLALQTHENPEASVKKSRFPEDSQATEKKSKRKAGPVTPDSSKGGSAKKAKTETIPESLTIQSPRSLRGKVESPKSPRAKVESPKSPSRKVGSPKSLRGKGQSPRLLRGKVNAGVESPVFKKSVKSSAAFKRKPETEEKSKSEKLEKSSKAGDGTHGDGLIGKRVKKKFDGALYNGEVVKFDNKTQFYKVKYEDGDQEDLEFHELEAILVPKLESTEERDDKRAKISSRSPVISSERVTRSGKRR
ncbi:hypothetical protein KP509_18G012300 [Ceratopteris richardii]|nr:hypothetical protein KP509_18G012300 [Ceratopteris richardii]